MSTALEKENAELKKRLAAYQLPACRGNPQHAGVPLDRETQLCARCFRTGLGLPAPHDFDPDRE